MIPSFLWDRIDASGDCWEWTGGHVTGGYSALGWDREDWPEDYVHRLTWTFLVGDIPEGLVIDHLCRNRGCVNPDHMEVVTQAVNKARGYSPLALRGRQTECKYGHPFNEENTKIVARGRDCRTCMKIRRTARTERDRIRRNAGT